MEKKGTINQATQKKEEKGMQKGKKRNVRRTKGGRNTKVRK